MEKCKKITGTWRGFYAYLKPEQLAASSRVSFTLVLKQGWFWRFAGSVTEDPPAGMPGQGRVEGYFSFPRVEFTKRMPVGYALSPAGQLITLRDHLRSHGVHCDQDLPHPLISCEGEFYDTNRIKGTWIIRPQHIPLPGGKALPIAETSGNWEMELQSGEKK
jgi:hypothetical protein